VLDTAAKTVSVSATHFSWWAAVKPVQIVPEQKTVRVNESVPLVVMICYPPKDPEQAPLGLDACLGGQTVSAASVSAWSVNGTLGGGNIFGTVSGQGATATYRAPANEPIPNTVAVSAKVHLRIKGTLRTVTVVSNITIAGHRWEGTGIMVNPAYTATADVVWTLEQGQNGISTYVPNGTVTVDLPCVTPNTMPISQSDGFLTIDFNASPPTYEGFGVTVWVASCGPYPVYVDGLWFAGRNQPGNRARGTVTVEPDGTMRIQDTDSYGDLIFNWTFERID
jgi:hypothetical protein